MKIPRNLLAAAFLVFALDAGAKPIVILPIGDSITQGGRSDRAEYTYRYPLFYKLKEAGYDVDFVGSLRTGLNPDAKWPDRNGVPFDPDHEGHYGWKTAAVRDNLREWSAKWSAVPDVALIHLGTNDQGSKDFDADIVRPLKDMVAFLRTKNPRVAVVIAHLGFNGGSATTIRPLVEAMAKSLNTTASPVKTVATYNGWIENPDQAESDTFDWAHPNERGQEKLAGKFFAAMKPLLGKVKKAVVRLHRTTGDIPMSRDDRTPSSQARVPGGQGWELFYDHESPGRTPAGGPIPKPRPS